MQLKYFYLWLATLMACFEWSNTESHLVWAGLACPQRKTFLLIPAKNKHIHPVICYLLVIVYCPHYIVEIFVVQSLLFITEMYLAL